MKIIIEQKDVGKEFDLLNLANILINHTTNEIWNKKSTQEEIDNSKKMLVGLTPAGAQVTIKKQRKKPGPKPGSRKKKQSLQQQIDQFHSNNPQQS